MANKRNDGTVLIISGEVGMSIEVLTGETLQVHGEGESLRVRQAPNDLDTFPLKAGSIALKKTVYSSKWRDMGSCTEPGTDPELFFPIGTSGPALLQAEQAKAYCADCPVREACLRTALDQGNVGVWGGTTELERKQMPQDERNAILNHIVIL